MGTRSTVKFYNNGDTALETPILSVYQQYDGYYSGVGEELADWLKSMKMINGISNQTIDGGFANGMGCLAAQYVVKFKTALGGFYLTEPDDMQGYDYQVYLVDGNIRLKVDDFDGEPKDFKEWFTAQEAEE